MTSGEALTGVALERSVPRAATSTRFLLHVHRLRAIAILCIVTVHCESMFTWQSHQILDTFLVEFFQNASVLFVFVAGFLFQHLARSYRYGNYLWKKLLNVLIPYVIVATPAIIYALYSENPVVAHPELAGTSLAYQIGWFYLNGGATFNWALWYVPMIALYFLAAPLFMLFESRPRLYYSLVVLIPLSLLAHRPTFTGGHNLELALYFLSSYILGMFCSQRGEQAVKFIQRNLRWMVALYLAILIGHTFHASHHGLEKVSHLFSFQYGYIDWLFLQKLLLSVVLLGVLPRFNNLSLPVVDYVADVSFTIYFLHMYVLFFLLRWTHNPIGEGNVFELALLVTFVVAVSGLIAYAARRLLGRNSRLLLGS